MDSQAGYAVVQSRSDGKWFVTANITECAVIAKGLGADNHKRSYIRSAVLVNWGGMLETTLLFVRIN